MPESRVSAIIVNWNGADHLRICLPSLQSQTAPPSEIIVVDNGSFDASESVVREFGVRWLPLAKNSGLAAALNRGAEAAAGNLLLFLNNDMRFDPAMVANLAESIEKDPALFAADAMQYNWDGSSRPHLAARLTKRCLDTSAVAVVPGLFFYQQEFPRDTDVFMASAACMMVRRDAFNSLGGFEERLPLGYEDTELCWRAWLAGWKVRFVPAAICWHRVGGSSKSLQGKRMNVRGILIGRLHFAMKLLPLGYATRTWLVSALPIARDLAKLDFWMVRARLAILIQMGILSPELFREKKSLFANAGCTPQEQLASMLRLTESNSS